MNTSVAEIRTFLNSDRVIIYRFHPDGSGVVVTESVLEPWQSILNLEITDTYFSQTIGQFYRQEMMRVTPDIYTAGFSPAHIELLQKLQVKAKLVVPILQASQLWGLLIVHHCRAPRQWQSQECELLEQLATQLAIAIQQSELYQQLQTANHQLQQLAMTDPLTRIANRRHFDTSLIVSGNNFYVKEVVFHYFYVMLIFLNNTTILMAMLLGMIVYAWLLGFSDKFLKSLPI